MNHQTYELSPIELEPFQVKGVLQCTQTTRRECVF